MPRPPKVWFRDHDGFYYTTLRGKQIKLARDRKEADKAFHTLLAHDEEPEKASHLRPSFKRLADDFLEHSHATNVPGTFDAHRRYLQSFIDHVKGRRAPDLRGEDVTRWLKAHPTWGQSTRSLAVQAVKAALNYAVGEGKLAAHPLIKVKQGPMRRRERIVTPAEREKIRARASGTFKDLVFALEQTGCRPFSEIGRLEAHHINWEQGTAELPDHKNKRHGKKRILYFTPPMLDVLRRLATEHPTGLLFRNRYGGAWDRMAWFKWSKLFERELGIKGVNSYAYRHTYATEAIMRGVPLPVLAELMGTSVRMLVQNYGHVGQKVDALKEAAIRAIT